MDNIKVNNFIKYIILQDNKLIKSFIENVKGGEGDEEALGELLTQLDYNRLGLPTQIQDKIDQFVRDHLRPMVDEPDIVFADCAEIGYVAEDGHRHIDTEEDLLKLSCTFYWTLHEIEEAWDEFAMEELHPYLML